MEIIKTTGKTCAMMSHGRAFIPSRGLDGGFSSSQMLFGSTELFSKAVKITHGTPLSLWQQRIIYLSPLAIEMLPSFHKPKEEAPTPKTPAEKSKKAEEGKKSAEPQSHYPLMIYDNIAKVLIVASVVIISREKGYHKLGGMCLQGTLLYARSYEVISIESYLVMQMVLKGIGSFSKMIVKRSLSGRVSLFVDMVSVQIFNVYQFPVIKKECDLFLKHKALEFIESNQEMKDGLQHVVDQKWIDLSFLDIHPSQQPDRSEDHNEGIVAEDEEKDRNPAPPYGHPFGQLSPPSSRGLITS